MQQNRRPLYHTTSNRTHSNNYNDEISSQENIRPLTASYRQVRPVVQSLVVRENSNFNGNQQINHHLNNEVNQPSIDVPLDLSRDSSIESLQSYKSSSSESLQDQNTLNLNSHE